MASREFMRPIQNTRYIMERFPVIQVSNMTELAEQVSAMPSSVIGIFSGKAAVGKELTGYQLSCMIIAKYIASSNYGLYLCVTGDLSQGRMAFGTFSTTDGTVNRFWTST